MSIPSVKERPDLYDEGYDGRPEGSETTIETPPDIQALIDAGTGGGKPAPGTEVQDEENPA